MKRWRYLHVIMIYLLFFSAFFVFPISNVIAATPDFIKTGQVQEFSIDAHTAQGGDGKTYYSRESTLMPSPIDLASLGVDTTKVRTATITSTLGTTTCTQTECTFTQKVDGIANPVHALTSPNPGYFDWWRNQAGSYHSNWWSFDLPSGVTCPNQNGVTCYSDAGGERSLYAQSKNTALVPRDFPGDYSYHTSDWSANGSTLQYTDDANISGLSYSYVVLESADVSTIQDSFVISHPASVTPNSSGVASFDAEVGPFGGSGNGFFPLENDPLGYRFPFGFNFNFKGTTYTYKGTWNLEVYYIGSSGVSVSNPGCMDLSSNNSKSLTATYTKSDGTTQNVTSSTNTSWSSSSPGVATVSPGGVVTAVGIGTTTIEAHYVDAADHVDEKGSTSLEVKTSCTSTPPANPKCQATIEPPVKGTIIPGISMDPRSHAVLKADNRGNEHFDVALGIPTSEDLYANVFGLNYLFQHKFANMTGQVTYKVEVTKNYTWIIPGAPGPPPGPATPMEKRVTQTMTVTRPYSYWQIDNLEVYGLEKSTIKNYALGGYPSETIQLDPTGYTEPDLESNNQDDVQAHVHPATCSGVDLGTGGGPPPGGTPPDFQGAADGAVGRNQVNNDKVIFNGQTIMENAQHPDQGQTPGTIPQPVEIGPNVLYKNALLVSNALANRANQPTSGDIYYELVPGNVKGGADKNFSINGINTVTVHTPVVNYSDIPDINRPFDQSMNPDYSKTVLVLGRPFRVDFDEKGQHLNYLGYGNNDYMKYTASKRVTFPFGVFDSAGVYHQENTWIYIDVGTPSATYRIPEWIDEGTYHITLEAWAINTQAATCQTNLNGDLINYCATKGIDVNVVGRVSDFRIGDIGDLRYESVFRTAPGSLNHTTNAYYSGGRDKDGVPTNMFGQNAWLMPIRPGSYPGQVATVPHNGYSFQFDFKTIGNYWDKGEGMRIDPTFWFVPRSGGSSVPVDLYYDASGVSNKMIRVGSVVDKQIYSRVYRLPDPLRNISDTDIQNAASYEYTNILTSSQQSQTPWSKFYTQFLSRKITTATGYDIEILPYKSRTIVGPPRVVPPVVDPTVALRSVQHWYGEYNLPIAPHILPKGTDVLALANRYGGSLDGHESEFLTKGYIVVNFGIYALKHNDQETRVLGYNSPNANMWAIEGQIASDQDYLGHIFQFRSGDIILFESDFSVRNDFQGQGH